MTDFDNIKSYGPSIISIENGLLKGQVMIDMEKGYIPLPLSEEDLSILRNYPNIISVLEDGELLYLLSNRAYIGTKEKPVLYKDLEFFNIKFAAFSENSIEVFETLEKDIKKSKFSLKRLIKHGENYYE